MLRGSQEQQPHPRVQDGSSQTQSWYPPSVLSSPSSSSRPASPAVSSSSTHNSWRPTESLHSPSHVPPAEAAGIIAALKDKRLKPLRLTTPLKLVCDLIRVAV